jgi:isoquinoline 1-oxidoreductase beta subunit
MKKNRKHLQLSRRDFLKLAGTTGAGLVLAVYLEACAPASATPEVVLVAPTDSTPTDRPPFDWAPNIYLNLDNNSNLTVTAFRSEMGQGIRTALAMLVADELDVDWSAVRIVQAPADSKYGNQVTGGSVSIRNYYDGMRKAGATARQMLVEAAAQAWGVKADACRTEAGYVIHPDGNQKLAYGDLVESAADLKVPRDVQLKDKSQLNIIGTGLGHWDAPDIVTGKAIYGFDVRLPDMLFAVIARCPVFDGRFESYGEAGALAVPGVRQVVEIDKSIAVVAENSWAAIQGRSALNVTWDEGRRADLSSEAMRLEAINSFPKPGSAGENSIDALYKMPYQAHATMEPMNCTVYVHDGICEVWAPTQNPQEVQRMVAAATRTRPDKVTVHVPLVGGGFGRRLEADYAFEAGQVARIIEAPVQVFWTREDDFQHDYYHEMSVHYANGSLSEVRMPAIGTKGGSGVPTGAWRSVGEFTEAYPTQCFIDEIAAATGRDPLDLRLELYDNRAASVIKLAAEKAGWGDPLPEGWGRGLAYHATFNVTHVAHVAEVSVDENGNVRVQRVVCAVDCGAVVNPDNIAAQMEGGIVFGLTAALKARVTIENGRAQQGNFHDYPLLQLSEMPVVEVHIIESDNRPSGIGEMGVPPIAPAVANAVFAATGKRVRHIPIWPEDLI